MQFEEITSRENRHIKQAVKLMSSGRSRMEYGLFVIEGMRLCTDAVNSGVEITAAFLTPDAIEKHPIEAYLVANAAQKAYKTGREAFEKLSETVSPQGFACVCKIPETALSPENIKPSGRYIACENLSDPSNLGAVARTAEAFGADGMLLIGNGCDIYSPKAQRAAMGSLMRLPVCHLGETETALTMLKNRGLTIYASVVDTDADHLDQTKFFDGSAILIGNEGAGLSDIAKRLCDHRITIPMKGRAESFNASAAAAILMWELLK